MTHDYILPFEPHHKPIHFQIIVRENKDVKKILILILRYKYQR